MHQSTRKRYWSDKIWWIHIPSSRRYSKIVRNRVRTPRTHSKAEQTVRRIGRVSSDRIYRWRWSACRLLVDPRWLHLSSSQWTSSSTLCVEGRNIPYSTKIHWFTKVYSHWSGRHARETRRWLLECWFKQKLVRFLERFHEVHSFERKTFQWIYVVREETGKSSNDYQTRSRMARSMD